MQHRPLFAPLPQSAPYHPSSTYGKVHGRITSNRPVLKVAPDLKCVERLPRRLAEFTKETVAGNEKVQFETWVAICRTIYNRLEIRAAQTAHKFRVLLDLRLRKFAAKELAHW